MKKGPPTPSPASSNHCHWLMNHKETTLGPSAPSTSRARNWKSLVNFIVTLEANNSLSDSHFCKTIGLMWLQCRMRSPWRRCHVLSLAVFYLEAEGVGWEAKMWQSAELSFQCFLLICPWSQSCLGRHILASKFSFQIPLCFYYKPISTVDRNHSLFV